MRPLTAILLVRDAAAVLPGCLDSLAGVVDRLAVLDTGSRDGTRDLLAREAARGRFAAVDVARGDLAGGFGAARQRLLEMVPGGWVLWIDADERLSPALRETLARRRTGADGSGDLPWGFRLPMTVEVMGRTLRCREVVRQRHLRLFRRAGAAFRTDQAVHEGVAPPPGAAIGELAAPLHHLACPDPRAYLAKIARYTDLEAPARARRSPAYLLAHLLVTGPATWWRLYAWRGCWRDGKAGLVWALLAAWSSVRRDLAALWFRRRGRRPGSGRGRSPAAAAPPGATSGPRPRRRRRGPAAALRRRGGR